MTNLMLTEQEKEAYIKDINFYKLNITSFYLKHCLPNDFGFTKLDYDIAKNWYFEANEYADNLAEIHGLQTNQAAAIISAFSPLKSWNANKSIASLFISKLISKHTKVQTKKAKEILNIDISQYSYWKLFYKMFEILKGYKTQSFYYNIALPDGEVLVTIDRHAMKIAGYNKAITKLRYRLIMEAYIQAANELEIYPGSDSLYPSQLQAITWVRYRQLKKSILQ